MLPINQSIKMTSADIADLINARHDSVRRTIERLANRGTIELPPMVEIATGARSAIEYVFEGELRVIMFLKGGIGL